jgi:acetyl esterase/lipase
VVLNLSTPPQIPAELYRLMAQVGPRWRSDQTGNISVMIEEFSKIHRSAPPDGMAVIRDCPYGQHERQKVDVYSPLKGARKHSAVIFVHGGAFTSGHRNRTAEIYSNVARYFARHGIIGVNMGYRLAPEARYPEATRDVGAAVNWLFDHADELGVDRDRIFLMGHSAGCAHAGSYAYDKRMHPIHGPGIAGVILVSGRLRADNRLDNPNARKVEAYYGQDAAVYDNASPITHIDAGSCPTFIAWAEYENAYIDIYSAELVWRLGVAKGKTPPIAWLKGHNHTSIIAHINTAEDDLGFAIRGFIERTTGSSL